MGLSAYLYKPFGHRELLNVIDNTLILSSIKKRNIELERETVRLKDLNESIIEATPLGMAVFDEKFNVIKWNRGCEKIYNIERKNILNKNFFEIVKYAKERQWDEIFNDIFTTGKIYQLKNQKYKRPTGKYVFMDATFGPIYQEDRITGIILITEDVTERIFLEEQIRDYTDQLEEKVEERTKELTQKNVELIVAMKKAKEADMLKSQFMSMISHELKTPLNSIIGFSKLMLNGMDGEINDLQKADLEHIYQSGEHLLGIVNDVLDFAKIEAGKMELHKENVELFEIVNEVMITSTYLLSAKVGSASHPSGSPLATGGKGRDIDLRVDISPRLPKIFADGRRIKQVLLNLMSNAIKFTEEGSIMLKVDVRENDNGKEVVFSVKDTGIGIKQEDQGKIFEAFRQIDASTARKIGGTGLGLIIAKNFVEMHSGRIWFESQFGKGTNFYFTIPVTKEVEVFDEGELIESV
jgi:PAS domain S-box-containing protein